MATNKLIRQDALAKLAELQKGYIDGKVKEATLTGSEAIAVQDKKVSLKIAEANKMLSQSADGLTATLRFNYVKKGDDTPAKLQLVGVGDAVVSELDVSDFVMDGMLADVQLEGNDLTFTFNTDAGEKTPITVDLSKYIDAYTAGNGIDITGNKVSAKVKEGDKYITVGLEGISSKGIDEAIQAATGDLDAGNIKATHPSKDVAGGTNVQRVLDDLYGYLGDTVKQGTGVLVVNGPNGAHIVHIDESYLSLFVEKELEEGLDYMTESEAESLFKSIYGTAAAE